MGALSANRNTQERDGEYSVHDVAANAVIYGGGAVALKSDGYAAPAANTDGYRFVGRAEEQVINTGGSDGDLTVKVKRRSVFKWASSGLAQSDEGADVFFSDDQTVTTTPGYCYAGKILEVVSATECWVDHEAAYAGWVGSQHTHASAAQGSVLNPYTALSQGRQGAAIAVVGGAGGIAAADLVYVSAVSGGVPTVLKAQGTSGGKFAALICPSAISAGAGGKGVAEYLLTGVNTSGGSVGDAVYLSDGTAGGWTLTKPTATDKVQIVGRVAKSDATDGEILFSLPGAQQIVHTHIDNAEGGLLTPQSGSVVVDKTPTPSFVIEAAIADSAGDTVIYSSNAPYAFRVVDAWAVKKASNGGAGDTVKVVGAGDITDAMDIGINDKLIVRAASVDDAQWGIAAGGSLKVTAAKVTNCACEVFIRCVRT